ncbi:MAG: transcription antitermination factor NusB [Myxococcales bacterium]|nr:hypothetical protein [Myxococcota bacterium]MDW8281006.1 transcription antitermination factor NusB [Myxococcales bacterium]
MRHGPRDVARRVLQRVEEGAYATLTLEAEIGRAALSARDRALCTELVYGVLRQRLRLDRALAAYAPRGLETLDAWMRNVLRLAAYQILFLRTPAYAAVNDAVGAMRRLRGERMAGFANALLRRLVQQGEPPLLDDPQDPEGSLSLSLSLPRWLVRDALRRFGHDEALRFLQSLNRPAPTWLRLNLLRGGREDALRALQAEGAIVHPSERLPEAVRVKGGEVFRGQAYRAGWFTAQDLGAQLVSRLACAGGLPPGPLLDACCGIGGKTTHLCMLTANQVDIDGADRSAQKLALCREHAERLGCARLRTLECDLTDSTAPLRPAYALVLLDAPCTGLGVLRRHPEARWRLEPGRVVELARLQARLLEALASRVMPGGVLVYAVCSYLDEEGPAQVAAFLARHSDFVLDPPPPDEVLSGLLSGNGSGNTAASLYTWPHRDDADGFYAVRLRRRHGSSSSSTCSVSQ